LKKTLLKHGASANVRDKQNLTALYDACVHGKVKCADALLQANSPLGFKDASNRSELHHACNFNTPELVELLIMFGAEMTAVNELGNSPLHVCASKGTIDCARVLLKKGANKDAVNAASNTPYQVAVMFNNHELAEVINSFKPEEVGILLLLLLLFFVCLREIPTARFLLLQRLRCLSKRTRYKKSCLTTTRLLKTTTSRRCHQQGLSASAPRPQTPQHAGESTRGCRHRRRRSKTTLARAWPTTTPQTPSR